MRHVSSSLVRSMALALGLALGLSACETATPYQPAAPHAKASGGYRDQRLDADHVRVEFSGNDVTSRSRVENDLLYRAAELTVQYGFDWFETVDHHTDAKTSAYGTSFGPYGYGAFAPYWTRYGPGYGGYWGGPFWRGPYWGGDFDVETTQRFTATADIHMGHGRKPASPRAFDAREVMANLRGHLSPPG